MKLLIEFDIKGDRLLDYNYNYNISSAIYYLLAEQNQEFASRLHNRGHEIGNKKFKLFVFSKFMPASFETSKNGILIKRGRAKLYVNSPLKEFIYYLGSSLMEKGYMRIGNDNYDIANVHYEVVANRQFDYESTFITSSPIVTTTSTMIDGKIKNETVHITEPKYVENIKNNLLKKYFLIHGGLPDDMNIEIEFDQDYIKKNPRGKLITIKGITVKGYIAPFKMKASEDVKNVAIDCGLGEKNSVGMGYMVLR